MLSETFKSFSDNLRDKMKNPFTEKNTTPFAGAFVLAFILYNWEFFFSLINFDSFESRVTKINILKTYLNVKTFPQRIVYPLIYAFSSIIFFYFFSNLSLGISIFFNRWFKALILNFTDKSKIVPRLELEEVKQRMNYLRIQHENIKQSFSDSLSTIENLKEEVAKRNTDISIVKELLDQKTNAVNSLNNSVQTFKDQQDDLKNKLALAEQTLDTEYVKEAIRQHRVRKFLADLRVRLSKDLVHQNILDISLKDKTEELEVQLNVSNKNISVSLQYVVKGWLMFLKPNSIEGYEYLSQLIQNNSFFSNSKPVYVEKENIILVQEYSDGFDELSIHQDFVELVKELSKGSFTFEELT